MSLIPPIVLLYGDTYLCGQNIAVAKVKYNKLVWITKSLETLDSDVLNDIQSSIWSTLINDSEKIVLIKDFPNKKEARTFISKIIQQVPSNTHLVLWDSLNNIKISNKEWDEIITKIRSYPDAKVINNGQALSEFKNDDYSINYVISQFEKNKRSISSEIASLLVKISGKDRSFLDGEIKKLCLVCDKEITDKDVLKYAFGMSKDSIIYLLSNALDSGDSERVTHTIDEFLRNKIHPNLIADIILKKTRWQLIICHLWYSGLSWTHILNRIMMAGRISPFIMDKVLPEEKINYLISNDIFRTKHFKVANSIKKEIKSECIPEEFMANNVIDCVKNNIVEANKSVPDLANKVINRALEVYLFVNERACNVRYHTNPEQNILEMTKALLNTKIV